MWDQGAWEALIGNKFDLCRCGHFKWKHDDKCYGVDIDDHSIVCDCSTYRPDLRVVE